MTPIRKLVDRQGLPFWLNDNGGFRTGVEIGTYRGEYAEHLLTHWAGALHCVDPWASLPKEEYLDGCVIDHSNMTPLNMDLIYADAKARLAKFGARVQLFRGTGDQFAAQYPQSVTSCTSTGTTTGSTSPATLRPGGRGFAVVASSAAMTFTCATTICNGPTC